jgi:phosphoglycolate phosphatase-like HAD superfamily hydrolase
MTQPGPAARGGAPADVIFDLDGTLFRTETVDVAAFNNALAAFGRQALPPAQILYLIGRPMERIAAGLLGSSDAALLKEFTALAVAYELELIPSTGALYDRVPETLRALRARGCRLHILSNGGQEYVGAIVEHFGLGEYFASVRARRYGVTKARALRQMMARYHMDGAWLVGDRAGDMEAARANGCRFVGALYGFAPAEVAGAEWRIRKIEELLEIL